MALFAATLSACGASRTDQRPQSTPAPVIERSTEVRLYCPAELAAPIAQLPAVPVTAVIEGNEAGLRWLGDAIAYARGLVDRFMDAKKVCP